VALVEGALLDEMLLDQGSRATSYALYRWRPQCTKLVWNVSEKSVLQAARDLRIGRNTINCGGPPASAGSCPRRLFS
jgi:hypothetical protein